MPYSHITRTAFGADAIRYARGENGKGHNGAEARNEYIAGVNMLPDSVVSFEQQMQPLWDRAHVRHTTQIDRLIVSFARGELDPEKPEDRLKGLAIGCEIARRNAPDNQSAVFLQTDGKGGLIHLHILTNDVNISDGRGIDPKAYAHWHFQQIVDEVCQQYFDLEKTELAPEKVNQAVRGARVHNEQVRAANAQEQTQAKAEGRAVDVSKIKPEKYIWQDDLRDRIKIAATGAKSEADFAQRLRLSGVELVPHKAKDGTVTYLHPATKKQPAHYTYELTDVSGFGGKVPQNLRAKSHKLGANYQPENVLQQAHVKAQPQAQTQAFTWQAPAAPQPPAQAVQEPDPVPIPTYKPKPATAPQKPKEKPPEKSPEEIRKEKEKQEMDRAKETARAYIGPSYNAFMGWGDDTPKDAEGYDDWTEAGRRMKQADQAWASFQQWRVDCRPVLKAEKRKLAPIYTKDKYGTVFVEHDELIKQFEFFLKHPNWPEELKQKQAQQASQGQTAQQPQEQAQQPGKTTGKVQPAAAQAPAQEQPRPLSEADRQRQAISARRSSVLDELERKAREIEQKDREKQQQKEDDWGLGR